MIPFDEDGSENLDNVTCLELHDLPEYLNFFLNNKVNDSLRIFHCNIRSIAKNFDELVLYIEAISTNIDFIVLSECWLTGGEESLHLDGYNIVLSETRQNRNDGVVIFINHRLRTKTTQISLGNVHGIRLDFVFNDKTFNLLALYRTFDSDTDTFLTQLEYYYEHVSKDIMCILLGDINIDTFKHDHTTDRYLNILYGFGLVQCIDKPTRVTGDTASCIDHIFVRYNDMSRVSAAVLQTSVTDHYSTALTVTTPQSHARTRGVPHSYIDRAVLVDRLVSVDWGLVTTACNADSCFDAFTNVISQSVEGAKKFSGRQTTRLKKIKPWITLSLIKSIRFRDKLSKRVKKQPFNIDLRNYYFTYRLNLGNAIKHAKRVYYRSRLNSSKRDPKLFWSVINELAGKTTKKESFPIEKFLLGTNGDNNNIRGVANDFNSFFSQVGYNLANVIAARPW